MINDFLTDVEITEDMWIGGNHFYGKDEFEYSLVTKASAVPCRKVKGEDDEVVVKLNLRRLSDGSKSMFREAVATDKFRKFIAYARKDETMAVQNTDFLQNIGILEGKVLGACYYENESIQVILDK